MRGAKQTGLVSPSISKLFTLWFQKTGGYFVYRFISIAQQQPVENFNHVDHEETGEGGHEQYLTMAEAFELEMS